MIIGGNANLFTPGWAFSIFVALTWILGYCLLPSCPQHRSPLCKLPVCDSPPLEAFSHNSLRWSPAGTGNRIQTQSSPLKSHLNFDSSSINTILNLKPWFTNLPWQTPPFWHGLTAQVSQPVTPTLFATNPGDILSLFPLIFSWLIHPENTTKQYVL